MRRLDKGLYASRASGGLALVSLASVLVPTVASAQSAAPGAAVQLPPIVVETPVARPAPAPGQTTKSGGGSAPRGPRAASAAAARPVPQPTVEPLAPPIRPSSPVEVAGRKLDALPGAAVVIGDEAVPPKANVTLSEQLAGVPGIVVQRFFGGNDQPRVQIRGSGLQQNPVERGLLVLQDGLPINRADGSYIVGLADPRSAEFTEVYKGYTANRLGATVLGGAINFSSPNGATFQGAELGVEGGSFGHLATTARVGGREGDLDGHASVTYSQRDGFRDHNESERVNVNANVGARINENVSTRLYFGYTDLSFDVAGPLPWSLLEASPRQVCPGPPTCLGPNVVRDLPHRDAQQVRVGSRTTARFGANLVDLAFGYAYTDDSFRFPISGGVRDTEGGDFTTVARYAYQPDASAALPLFEATGQYVVGSSDRFYYINNRGARGALVGENDLASDTLSLHAGFNIPIADRLTLSPAIGYSYAARENDDLYDLNTRPFLAFTPSGVVNGARPFQDTSYDRTYSGWTPSIGLSYELAKGQSLFVAASRSFEPPTHDDLIATINGSPNSSAGQTGPAVFATPDLDAQTATTIEGGWKGRANRLSWSAIAYHSWISNELLNLRDASGVSLGAVNADRTTHFGIELAGQVRLTEQINARVAYTYQDFRFDGDALHGDNRLAGAPRHLVNAALRYSFRPDVFVETSVMWVPDETPVDNANTLFSEGYAVVDLRGYYGLTDKIGLYGEVLNVFNEVYASSTLVVDAVANPDQGVFLPGDGRAFIAGLKARF